MLDEPGHWALTLRGHKDDVLAKSLTDAAVAEVVLVFEFAADDIGDDFHIAVRVHAKAAAGLDASFRQSEDNRQFPGGLTLTAMDLPG